MQSIFRNSRGVPDNTDATSNNTLNNIRPRSGSRGNDGLKSARGVRRLYQMNIMSPREDLAPILDELYGDAIEMANHTECRAIMYRAFHLGGTVFIMTAGAAVTALGLTTGTTVGLLNGTNTSSRDGIIAYVVGVLGLIITLVKGMLITFSIEKRAREFKTNSVKLKKIARNVKSLKNNRTMSTSDILAKIDSLYNDIDNIEISIFSSEPQSTVTDTIAMGSPDTIAMGSPDTIAMGSPDILHVKEINTPNTINTLNATNELDVQANQLQLSIINNPTENIKDVATANEIIDIENYTQNI